MRVLQILFCFSIFTTSVQAQSLQDTIAKLDKVLARYKPEAPGCQLSISRNGILIYSKAFGTADLEHQVPLTKKSVIEAGSASKQFTAAAILLLEQQHKLSLNDDIRKYLPEIPAYGSPILVRNLLHHTSGLHDWTDIAEIAGLPRNVRNYSNDDILYITSNQKVLNFKPGSRYLYSNTNYILLAIIVSRVSGKSLAQYTDQYMFKPAGMVHTGWRSSAQKIVPNRAIAYALDKEGYRTDTPIEDAYGAGGLLTTTEDLLKWYSYCWDNKFGSPSLLPKQISLDTLNDGSVNNYGAGLFIGQKDGRKLISHGGATASYRAQLETFPELRLSIAWLTNTSQFDSSGTNIVSEAENFFVSKKENTEPGTISTFKTSLQALQEFTGSYKSGQQNTPTEIIIKNGKLNTFGIELVSIAPRIFKIGEVTFNFDKLGHLTVVPPNSDPISYYKDELKKENNSRTDDKQYLGKFYSTEAQASFTITIKDKQLELFQAPHTHYKLTRLAENVYAIEGLAADLQFITSQTHPGTSLLISTQRSANVVFNKL